MYSTKLYKEEKRLCCPILFKHVSAAQIRYRLAGLYLLELCLNVDILMELTNLQKGIFSLTIGVK